MTVLIITQVIMDWKIVAAVTQRCLFAKVNIFDNMINVIYSQNRKVQT